MSSQVPSPPATRPDLRVAEPDAPPVRYQALGYRAKRLLLTEPGMGYRLVGSDSAEQRPS